MGGGRAATCASLHGEPVPLDLSGEVKRFEIDHDTRSRVRAMTRGDLPDVARWRPGRARAGGGPRDGEPTVERVDARSTARASTA